MTFKNRKQDSNDIGTLINPHNSHIITDPTKKANVLNNRFKSIFTIDNNISTIPDKGPSVHPSLTTNIRDYRTRSPQHLNKL